MTDPKEIDKVAKEIYEIIQNSKLNNGEIISTLECIKIDIIMNKEIVTPGGVGLEPQQNKKKK